MASNSGMPLRAHVCGGQLTIKIGVKTLAFAFEHSEDNNPYNEASGEFERAYSIADPSEFAKDVCRELNDEGEDGSTPLTRFLDEMMQKAVDNGSLGVADPDELPVKENPNARD